MSYRESSHCFWYYFVPFARTWGVFTAIVICGVGLDIAMHRKPVGYYYILFSLMVFFLEVTWAITLFIQVCIRKEMVSCWSCWSKVLWIDHWKKSLTYTFVALILLAKSSQLWLSLLAGLQLLSLGGCHLILGLRRARTARTATIPAPRLLHSLSPSQEDKDDEDGYDEVIDDSFPQPLLTSNDTISDRTNTDIMDM